MKLYGSGKHKTSKGICVYSYWRQYTFSNILCGILLKKWDPLALWCLKRHKNGIQRKHRQTNMTMVAYLNFPYDSTFSEGVGYGSVFPSVLLPAAAQGEL